MTKTFPKSRVCVIDACPSIEQGLRKALTFSKHYNISLNSNDGKKLIYSFCLKQLEQDYLQTESPYKKVLFASKNVNNKRIESFIDNYFEVLIKRTSLPYCGRHNVSSPDLETAAQSCTNKHTKFTYQRFQELLKGLSKS